MNYTEKGSRAYLFSIVLVAVLGGLLFGYDTAVISGAEKGFKPFSWEQTILSIPIPGTESLPQVLYWAVFSAVRFPAILHPVLEESCLCWLRE